MIVKEYYTTRKDGVKLYKTLNDWYWLEVSNSTNKIQLRSGGNFATGWTLYYREIR